MLCPINDEPRARARHTGTQGDYLNRRCLWTCLSVVSTPVVYHQAMSDHASTQIIANRDERGLLAVLDVRARVPPNLKSACFVPCESCMAAAAVSSADRFSSFGLWCPMRQGQTPSRRVHGLTPAGRRR